MNRTSHITQACVWRPTRRDASCLIVTALCGALLLLSAPAFADEPAATPDSQQPQHGSMSSMGNTTNAPATSQMSSTNVNSPDMGGMEMGPGKLVSKGMGSMRMGKMQGGSAPPGARDPNAYSDGYEYADTPGMERADKSAVRKVLIDQLEYTRSDEGDGVAWDAYAWYGPDENKLHLRSEGGVVNGAADFTTGAEALWWHGITPFWATEVGVHQDFGLGSRTALAFGVEGLSPYWVEVNATGFVDYEGRVSARLKGSYDVRLTNRLILTPEVESNLYSRANRRRGVAAGIANVELSVRLRYEFSRKFAPYVGFDWDRALGGTAGERRADGEPVSDAKFVAGLRIWF